MLADTDAGSIITAAQSGVQWKYSLVLPQLLLIPFLYVIQEMTVRLGIVTGKGHGELIRIHFGNGWAWLSALTLIVSVVGALVTEYAALSGVAQMLGISPWFVVPSAMLILMGIFLSGSYVRVEKIALVVGLFEVFFILAAFLMKPDLGSMGRGLIHQPLGNPDYRFLLAANVGAVIMPWMIFYQQGAVVEKKLSKKALQSARWDTALGAVLTQVIMIAVVITAAAVARPETQAPSISSAGDLIRALSPVLGSWGALLVIGFGMLGAGLIAAIVVSAAGAWGLGEAFGLKSSFSSKLKDAKAFYGVFVVVNLVAGAVVLSGVNLTEITVDVEVMNALLLPLVLGFLLLIERKALPKEYRMKGFWRFSTWVLTLVVISFGLYMAWDVFHHL
ncbi:MAG: divalent metal cation transporter [Spirochaetales bacterium]|nr:divalent metal cation transporter [Spirochaetales bacterium]